MKRFTISENERKNILKQHKDFILNEEQATGVQVPIETGLKDPNAKATTQTPQQNQPVTQTQNYTIQDIQNLLNQRGYNVGKADNILGKGTLGAIDTAMASIKTSQAAVEAQRQQQATITTPAPTQQTQPVLPEPPVRQSTEPEITLATDTSQKTAQAKTTPDYLNPEVMSRLRYANK